LKKDNIENQLENYNFKSPEVLKKKYYMDYPENQLSTIKEKINSRSKRENNTDCYSKKQILSISKMGDSNPCKTSRTVFSEIDIEDP